MSSLSIAVNLMSSDAGVTEFSTAAGIYPIEAPQMTAAPPFYVLNIVGNRDQQLLKGAAGYYQGRVRVECMAETAVVVDMGNAVLAALEDIVKQTVAGFRDVDVWFANTDSTDSSNDRGLKRRILDFYVQYRV